MKTAGIIVEFNPLHNGHIEHLHETKKITECEKIIAVMSGNFVQRGEPAICDKWRRTKMALLSGVDIVIEIPVPYVISGADYFARASVELLAATGVVDVLSFGSESGDINMIKQAGKILAEEPLLYKEVLRENLDKGNSFAAARGAALETFLGETPQGLLTKPNNCLAMEYCKALYLLGEPMKVVTTHRKSGGASATKIRGNIRNNVFDKEHMPQHVSMILEETYKNGEIVTIDDFSEIFRYLLCTREFNLGEGLGNRLKKFCNNFIKISDILAAAKTKRYTLTRLQRAAMGIILDITSEDMRFYENNSGVKYIRVLGFRKESANLLSEMTKRSLLPVITNANVLLDDKAAIKMLEKEIEAGEIYGLIFHGGYINERCMGVVKQ